MARTKQPTNFFVQMEHTTGASNHYKALGVKPRDSDDAIRAAFHALVRRLHPDVVPKGQRARTEAAQQKRAEEWDRYNDAYNAIKTEAKRKEYDKRLKATMTKCSACDGTGKLQGFRGFKVTSLGPCAGCEGTGKVYR